MMNKPIKILHLEDSKFDAEIVERELQISDIPFIRLWVTNQVDFKKAIINFSPDIILSDHSLPSFSSVQALAMLREMGIDVPFILITGTISEEFAVSILKEGASDYLLKDHMQRLPEAIVDAISKWHDEQKQKAFFQEILHNEQKFRSMVEHIPLGISILSREGQFIYQNPAAAQITTYTQENLGAKNLSEWVHPADLHQVLGVWQTLSKNPGTIAEKEFRTLSKNGFIKINAVFSNQLQTDQIPGILIHFREIKD